MAIAILLLSNRGMRVGMNSPRLRHANIHA
jgi:hypothetical protein